MRGTLVREEQQVERESGERGAAVKGEQRGGRVGRGRVEGGGAF